MTINRNQQNKVKQE